VVTTVAALTAAADSMVVVITTAVDTMAMADITGTAGTMGTAGTTTVGRGFFGSELGDSGPFFGFRTGEIRRRAFMDRK
jgi:hypothetical protein